MTEAVTVALIAAAPATVAAVAALVQGRRNGHKVDAVHDSMGSIHHEVVPNHGGSLRDAVDRIERAQETMTKDLGGLRAEVRDVRSDVSHSLRDHVSIRREAADAVHELRGDVVHVVEDVLSNRLARQRASDRTP